MVERLAAALRGGDEHAQILARRLLADELVERLRPQRGVDVLGRALWRGDPGGVGCHQTCRCSPLRRCHGQRPSISTSRLKLRNVRMMMMPARTAMLSRVGVTATVLMMSAATRNSRPSRIARPRLERKFATATSRSEPRAKAVTKIASVPNAPTAMMPMPKQLDDLGDDMRDLGGISLEHQSWCFTSPAAISTQSCMLIGESRWACHPRRPGTASPSGVGQRDAAGRPVVSLLLAADAFEAVWQPVDEDVAAGNTLRGRRGGLIGRRIADAQRQVIGARGVVVGDR